MGLRSVLVVLGAFGVLGIGCKSKQDVGRFGNASPVRTGFVEAGAPVPAGDQRAASFRYALAVFSTPGAVKVDADAVVRASVDGKEIAVRSEFANESRGQRILVIRHPGVRDYAPPSAHNLA